MALFELLNVDLVLQSEWRTHRQAQNLLLIFLV